MSEIEILDQRFLPEPHKSTLAYFDILINGIIIKDFRIMRNGNGKTFVKYPFTTYKDRTGSIKFRQIIFFPERVGEEVESLLLNTFFNREKENVRGEKSIPANL